MLSICLILCFSAVIHCAHVPKIGNDEGLIDTTYSLGSWLKKELHNVEHIVGEKAHEIIDKEAHTLVDSLAGKIVHYYSQKNEDKTYSFGSWLKKELHNVEHIVGDKAHEIIDKEAHNVVDKLTGKIIGYYSEINPDTTYSFGSWLKKQVHNVEQIVGEKAHEIIDKEAHTLVDNLAGKIVHYYAQMNEDTTYSFGSWLKKELHNVEHIVGDKAHEIIDKEAHTVVDKLAGKIIGYESEINEHTTYSLGSWLKKELHNVEHIVGDKAHEIIDKEAHNVVDKLAGKIIGYKAELIKDTTYSFGSWLKKELHNVEHIVGDKAHELIDKEAHNVLDKLGDKIVHYYGLINLDTTYSFGSWLKKELHNVEHIVGDKAHELIDKEAHNVVDKLAGKIIGYDAEVNEDITYSFGSWLKKELHNVEHIVEDKAHDIIDKEAHNVVDKLAGKIIHNYAAVNPDTTYSLGDWLKNELHNVEKIAEDKAHEVIDKEAHKLVDSLGNKIIHNYAAVNPDTTYSLGDWLKNELHNVEKIAEDKAHEVIDKEAHKLVDSLGNKIVG